MKRTIRILLAAVLCALLVFSTVASASAAGCSRSPRVIVYRPNCYGSNGCQSNGNGSCDQGCSRGYDLSELLRRYGYSYGNSNGCGDSSCSGSSCTPAPTEPAEVTEPAEPAPEPTERATQPATEAATEATERATQPTTAPAAAPTTSTYTVSAYEREVVALVNEIRSGYGLSALSINTRLSEIARMKSQDMHDKGYFSHTSPTYGSPFDMMKQFGITYRTAGENIAMGYRTPQAVVDGWMNSPGHRANILNTTFTSIGVGYVADGNYWTQMFIG